MEINGKTEIQDEFISLTAGQFRFISDIVDHRIGGKTTRQKILFQTVSIPTTDTLSCKDIGKRRYICDTYILGDIPEFNMVLYEGEIVE
jgi:hypothetical protein